MEEVKESDAETEKTGAASSDCSNDNSDHADRKPVSFQGRMAGPTRVSKGGWTEEKDKLLALAVRKFNEKNWKKIAECVPNRTDVQCLHRWQKVLNPDLVKGPWTKTEDELIIELFSKKHGNHKWSEIAKSLPGRIGKQCRERWYNHLNPEINRTPWT
ncbi:transcription factor MYB3R-3-like isoform X2 [Actinidia eriantha]|uniref:transcription factor MYB3R-3-like isoform X2 n=1 Tax=Actinidia eriantha TaxID=165200 RepID=UPI00258EC818|nr:transcription factor MYB3R-3-like isoform X2 [Actinidia eriantha]